MKPRPVQVPLQRAEVDTADIGFAHELLSRAHVDHRVRLFHAHRDLLAADPATTTVSAVAARYGFAHHSRFTATYPATYGVLPNSTLHGH